MNVRELECFLAVVDQGSITRAASALYLAQPSLSQIIRRLESDLGVELFRRVGRGLVLAPAGEALVGPARQVVRDMHRARQVAESYRGSNAGGSTWRSPPRSRRASSPRGWATSAAGTPVSPSGSPSTTGTPTRSSP